MKKVIKIVFCISLLASLPIGAMQVLKKGLHTAKKRISNMVSHAQLKVRSYTQQELDQKLFETASVDPDQKINIIKKLIDLGANVNYTDEQTKFTPLYTAIAAGYLGDNEKTIELLLASRADAYKKINIAGIDYTPLTWAQLAQNSPAVIALLPQAKDK